MSYPGNQHVTTVPPPLFDNGVAMRIAIGVSYDGSPFEGWQSQASGNTVQDRLEAALARIAGVLADTAAVTLEYADSRIDMVADLDLASEGSAASVVGAWADGSLSSSSVSRTSAKAPDRYGFAMRGQTYSAIQVILPIWASARAI